MSDAWSEALVGLLAEESRLKVLSAIVLGAMLERREGFYWRTSGTFDLDEQCAD